MYPTIAALFADRLVLEERARTVAFIIVDACKEGENDRMACAEELMAILKKYRPGLMKAVAERLLFS
jgi:hypothetical protein